MDSKQITRILTANRSTHSTFLGCFPCDLLPSPVGLNKPSTLIVNLDPHHLKGSHWVAIYADNQQKAIYFDSLALPIKPVIAKFFHEFNHVVKNSHPFQSVFSNACAHYCICFVYFISTGYTFKNFLDLLEHSIDSDLFVKNFVNKIVDS